MNKLQINNNIFLLLLFYFFEKLDEMIGLSGLSSIYTYFVKVKYQSILTDSHISQLNKK